MSSVDIISLAADNPGASYVRIVIAGSVYSEAFPTVTDMRRYFRIGKPKDLKGFPFPETVFDTRVDFVIGDNNQHKVIAVLNGEGSVRYYVIGGPGGHMSERTFTDFGKAVDFARGQLTV